jgi:GNAT superfamily N-acetyltransferase
MTPIVTNLTQPGFEEWLFKQLRESYWGAWLSESRLAVALTKSICFWLVLDGKPIGFARVVTDHATFSFVCDVIVEEQHRGQGYGKQLMTAVVACPAVYSTICVLDTRDADELYQKFGFERLRTIMQRAPDL